MPLFQPSTTVFVSACQQIADSVGASGDGEMTTRAAISLNAAIRHFNNKYRWNFLWSEANPIQLVAPFVTGVTASAGQASAIVAASHPFKVDDLVVGSGFLAGTRITATGNTSIFLNTSATGFTAGAIGVAISGVRDFYDLPSDYKVAYSARLLQTNTWLPAANRRIYDRLVGQEFSPSTPEGYDTFMVGGKGKVRILPPPIAVDVLELRYHRAMATASASASTVALDIPSDHEPYLMAWAKWHFLTDKDQTRSGQASTWLALAQEGLVQMLREQTNQPDVDAGFSPGGMSNASWNPNTTRDLNYNYETG